jgi:L-rhamnonate dehydratase
MQITAIRAVKPPTPGAPDDWRTQLGQILVRIDTEDGLSGYGVGGGGLAGVHVVNTVFRDMLLAKDATNVEASVLFVNVFLRRLAGSMSGSPGAWR